MAQTTDQQLADLYARRDTILNRLANWTDETSIGDKANASGPGTNIDHVGYRLSLYRELNMIRAEILALEGPVEVDHLGI